MCFAFFFDVCLLQCVVVSSLVLGLSFASLSHPGLSDVLLSGLDPSFFEIHLVKRFASIAFSLCFQREDFQGRPCEKYWCVQLCGATSERALCKVNNG